MAYTNIGPGSLGYGTSGQKYGQPVSKGQSAPKGNAILSFPLRSGSIDLMVWISSFATGTNTQFDSNQVHRGISWFPIRRSEMQVDFQILWPHQSQEYVTTTNPTGNGFIAMQAFQDLIRQHQRESALTNGSPIPITFTYFNNSNNENGVISNNLPLLGNNKLLQAQANKSQNVNSTQDKPLRQLTYQGWIQTSEKEYTRFKSVYSRNYKMNILNIESSSGITNTTITTDQFVYGSATNNYLTPTANSTNLGIGVDWISTAGAVQSNAIDISQITGR